MLSAPDQPEINKETIKLLIGLIALFLASVVSIFHAEKLDSISEYYHAGGWSRDFLVGFLFAITAFMLAYNGESRTEMILSKLAAFAAFGVAMFPCECNSDYVEAIPHLHYISAAVMFSVLLYFCYIFYVKAIGRGHPEALRRSKVYFFCAIAILTSIMLIFFDYQFDYYISETKHIKRLVFYCETAGLIAFGISWLTASKVLPFLANEDERHNPLS